MKLEELFKEVDGDEEKELKELLGRLYDEDKLDFNTELTSSQVWLFTELETLTSKRDKWSWVDNFIQTYERKVISLDRKGRGEIIRLRKNDDNHDIRV
jgi:hypothetical protein